MRSEDGPDCYQRVKLEKPINRPAAQLPKSLAHRGDDAEPEKEQEKENLAYPSGLDNLHI